LLFSIALYKNLAPLLFCLQFLPNSGGTLGLSAGNCKPYLQLLPIGVAVYIVGYRRGTLFEKSLAKTFER